MANYGEIISKSIETTKKYKWLWIYGLVIAAASGGSGGGNYNLPNNLGDTNSLQNLPQPSGNPEEVLGAVTNAAAGWLGSINPSTWSLLGLGILVLILVGIGVSWVLSTWANGALIGGLSLAHKNREANLKTTSPIGFANVKKLIILGIIHFFMMIAGIIVAGLVGLVLAGIITFLPQSLGIVKFILGAVGVGGLLYLLINYVLTMIFAQRYTVLDGVDPWDSWTKAWGLSTRNFFPAFLMGLINFLIGLSVGCGTIIVLGIVLGIPGYIFLLPMITQKQVVAPNVVALVIIVILLIWASTLVTAIMSVFNASNWNLFFEQINTTYKKGSQKDAK